MNCNSVRYPGSPVVLAFFGLALLASACDDDCNDPTGYCDWGHIDVSAQTAGPDPDPDGYELTVDGESKGTIASDGDRAVRVRAGTHTVTLGGVAQNCAVQGSAWLDVQVTTGARTPAAFDVACTAIPQPVNVSVSSTGSGSGSIVSTPAGIGCQLAAGAASGSCEASFEEGTVLDLTATPATGSGFGGWSGAGCGGTATCSFTVGAAATVTAEFALQQFTLTVEGIGDGSGTVTSDPPGITAVIDEGGTFGTYEAPFAYGTTVTLTGVPEEGSLFAFGEPECDEGPICAIELTTDRRVLVQFSFSLAPTITTMEIPAGLYNRTYEQQFEVTDGWGPLAWSLWSGELPPGLTLSSDGLLSGTIAAYGGPPDDNYEFEVRVEETDFLDRFDVEPFGISVAFCGTEPDAFIYEFTTPAGSNPAPQTIRIAETCGGAFDWSATPSASWISVSPASGRVEANGEAEITLSVDATGFAPDLYAGDIQLNLGVEVEFVDVVLTVE